MTRSLLLVAVLVSIPAVARADDLRGKVEWRYDVAKAKQESRKSGKPLLLYFVSDRSPACRQLAGEVFSKDAPLRSLARLIPVFVDCSLRSAPQDLQQKHQVAGVFPTLVVLDPTGKLLERTSDPKQLPLLLERVAKLGAGLFGGLTLTEGNDKALGAGKLLAVFFSDERPQTQARSQAMRAVLEADEMAAIQARCVWVQRALREGKSLTAEAKRLGVSRAPTLILLEPTSRPPSKKQVLTRYTASKDLRTRLERFFEKRDEEAEAEEEKEHR